jgi:hypothetical protein
VSIEGFKAGTPTGATGVAISAQLSNIIGGVTLHALIASFVTPWWIWIILYIEREKKTVSSLQVVRPTLTIIHGNVDYS